MIIIPGICPSSFFLSILRISGFGLVFPCTFPLVEYLPNTWPAGTFSKSGGKDGGRLSGCSSRASSASMAPTGKTECEILQSANVKIFSFNNLKAATRNFRPDSVLGVGGFGSVYKGWVDEKSLAPCRPGTGIAVAVKRLNQEGLQGHREWLVSIMLLNSMLLSCKFMIESYLFWGFLFYHAFLC